jgi:ABC-2 type transport system ATP-binding protein
METAMGRCADGAEAAPPLVEARGLTKRYGARTAVDGLSMSVRRGEVYGFLGPNGAGKTTTLRMLLGLIRPSSGVASVASAPPGSPQSLARVGALVESPAFYPYLSGRDNLRALAHLSGAPASRVEEALGLVDLAERAGDKYRAYSLGMKQRLGVAAALLKDPHLLILDEPTNGLDPQGVVDMRRLIRELGRGHRTVLLSSHLLGEVEQICDRVGVIRRGRVIAEGTVAELRGEPALIVRAEPIERAEEIIARVPGVRRVDVRDGALRLTAEPTAAAEVNARLAAGDVRVLELRTARQSLEDAFLELTDEKEG